MQVFRFDALVCDGCFAFHYSTTTQEIVDRSLRRGQKCLNLMDRVTRRTISSVKPVRRGMRCVSFVLFVNQSNMSIFVVCKRKSNSKYYIMTQTNKKELGGVAYCAPSVSVMDVHNEGLLCTSTNSNIKDWERDDQSLDF